jgi:hypothetical protein
LLFVISGLFGIGVSITIRSIEGKVSGIFAIKKRQFQQNRNWRFFSAPYFYSNLNGVIILVPGSIALRESVIITVAVVFSM